MYGRNYHDDRDENGRGRRRGGCGRVGRAGFGPPLWARFGNWEDASTSKERKAWLDLVKARLESRLEEINAEIEKINAEQKQ